MLDFRVLITGSRDWTDQGAVERALDHCQSIADGLGKRLVVVHGDCPTGADAIAQQWAEMNGVHVERHPARWDKHGKAAGPIRNDEMTALGANICYAFPLGESRGTNHCINSAHRRNITVVVISPESQNDVQSVRSIES